MTKKIPELFQEITRVDTEYQGLIRGKTVSLFEFKTVSIRRRELISAANRLYGGSSGGSGGNSPVRA